MLPAGAIANQFQAFEDGPLNWDAWDIDIFYDDRMWLAEPAESVRVVEAGPLRGTLAIKRRLLNSTITQRIALGYNSPRLDFDTQVDWQERHILLKAAFPVDVLAPQATYEIQWGNVERPTHRNTSWDWARFETVRPEVGRPQRRRLRRQPAQRLQVRPRHRRTTCMRLRLLRGTTEPDPQADLGEHRFTYSLFPHAGPWNEATIAAAYALNDPLVVAPGSGRADRHSPPVTAGCWRGPAQRRDRDGQARRGWARPDRAPVRKPALPGSGSAKDGLPAGRSLGDDLIEDDQAQLTLDEDGALTLSLRPFQIVTLRLIAG